MGELLVRQDAQRITAIDIASRIENEIPQTALLNPAPSLRERLSRRSFLTIAAFLPTLQWAPDIPTVTYKSRVDPQLRVRMGICRDDIERETIDFADLPEDFSLPAFFIEFWRYTGIPIETTSVYGRFPEAIISRGRLYRIKNTFFYNKLGDTAKLELIFKDDDQLEGMTAEQALVRNSMDPDLIPVVDFEVNPEEDTRVVRQGENDLSKIDDLLDRIAHWEFEQVA